MSEDRERCGQGPALLWIAAYGLGLGVVCVGGVLGLMWWVLS